MKKKITIILSLILILINLVGCSGQSVTEVHEITAEYEMTEEQIIRAVKNGKFENHTQKTIGEYFDLYAASAEIELAWSVQTDNVEELTKTDMTDKEGVVCVFSLNDELSFFWFFSYDKKSKEVEVIEIDTVGDKTFVFTEKSDINQVIDTIVYSAN